MPFGDTAGVVRGTLTSVTTTYAPLSRASGLAVGGLVLAVVVGLGSFLLGLVPFVVEPPGSADPVSCGSTWFRGAGLPAECHTELDVWAVAAQTGLVVAAVLVVGSALAYVRARRKQGEQSAGSGLSGSGKAGPGPTGSGPAAQGPAGPGGQAPALRGGH
jgi:hypothetical protein